MRTEVSRILLTGGSGFVGRHLAPELALAFPGAARTMLVRTDARERTNGWETVCGDLTDAASIDLAIRRVDPELVIHLAANSAVAGATPIDTWATNAIGTFTLASALARFAPEATVLLASSGEVYGASFGHGRVDEASPLVPLNAYAASKIAAEQIFHTVLPRGSQLIVARGFNHTGPGQDVRFVLPSFAMQISQFEAGLRLPFLRTGNLEAERDFLDVRDVVQAYLKLLAARDLPRRAVINVTSGRTFKLRDLVVRMQALAFCRFDIVVDPERLRPSDIPKALGDPSLLMQLTDWRPVHSIEETLQSLLDYWRLKQKESGPTAH